MEPVSISIAVAKIVALIKWKEVLQGMAGDAAKSEAKSLVSRLKPDEREKNAKKTVELFLQEFLTELEDKTPLSGAIPGYYDQVKILVEHAAPDITAWVQPETKDVDLGPVLRMWDGLKLDPLPEDFDWSLVSKSFAREIRRYVKSDPALREELNTALLEQQAELQQKTADAVERMAGPDPGFDLTGDREFLRAKCGQMQLSVMHQTAYDRRIELWSVFVP
jgi:hypothetical protein